MQDAVESILGSTTNADQAAAAIARIAKETGSSELPGSDGFHCELKRRLSLQML
jgi:hypothetical protein